MTDEGITHGRDSGTWVREVGGSVGCSGGIVVNNSLMGTTFCARCGSETFTSVLTDHKNLMRWEVEGSTFYR